MKTTVLKAALPLMLLAACTTDSGYEIKGTINLQNAEGRYIYIRPHNQRNNLDSALIKNNTFILKGETASPKVCDLYLKGENKYRDYAVPFVLENAQMTATIDTASFDRITGTIENDALCKFNQLTAEAVKDYDKYIADYKSNDKELKETANQKLTEMFQNAENIKTQFIINNTDKLVSAMFFTESFYSMEDKDLFAVVDKADSTFLSFPGMEKVLKIVDKRKQVTVGKKFTDFEMPNLKNKNQKLSDFVGKGKVVLIDFWASWCGPCRASMPDLIKTYNQYKNKGFDIVGVSLDNKKENWEKGIKDLKLPWNQLSDLQGWKCKGAGLYGVNSIPHTVLVDKDGIIAAKNLHGEALNKKIEELLK